MTPQQRATRIRAARSKLRMAEQQLNAAVRELARLGVRVTFRRS